VSRDRRVAAIRGALLRGVDVEVSHPRARSLALAEG
jgi:hypothetical protein